MDRHPCVAIHPELNNLHLHARVSTVQKENFGKFSSNNSIELGVPFHISLVMDSERKEFSLFINGQLDFCKRLLPGDTFTDGAGPLCFGDCFHDPNFSGNGTITVHSCFIHLKALTKSEISDLVITPKIVVVDQTDEEHHSVASTSASEELAACNLLSGLTLSEK